VQQPAGRPVVEHPVGALEGAAVLGLQGGDEARLEAADGDGAVFVVREVQARVGGVEGLVPADLFAAVAGQGARGEGRVAKEGCEFAGVGGRSIS
jgi:hypothetical protein